MEQRRRTSVRRQPGEAPTTVLWSESELAALNLAAQQRDVTVSDVINAIISEACWTRGADGSLVRLVAGVDDAAEAAHMPLATWIRVVVLGALGIAPIDLQIEQGRRAWVTGVGNDQR